MLSSHKSSTGTLYKFARMGREDTQVFPHLTVKSTRVYLKQPNAFNSKLLHKQQHKTEPQALEAHAQTAHSTLNSSHEHGVASKRSQISYVYVHQSKVFFTSGMHITRKAKCSQPASHLTLYGQPLEKVNITLNL